MSKISELTDGGSLLPTDTLIAVRSGANVKVVNDTINVTTLNPDQINMGDNEQIRLGNSQDLLIYHDGTNSRIDDNGTGNLLIQTGGSTKLEVTSTGIDVTGTAVTDGVTVSGNILLQVEGNELQFNTSSTPVNKIYSDDTYTSNGLTISADNGVALQSTNNYLLLDDTGTNEMVLNVDGGERMRVTSTGIDVTGTVTADGLTVDGQIQTNIATTGRSTLAVLTNTAALAINNQATIQLKNGGQSVFISGESVQANAGMDLVFSSNNSSGTETTKLRLAEDGDISFYEDTGTTAKFFWDASAESLGIGTDSPQQVLQISQGANATATTFRIENTDTTIDAAQTANAIEFYTNDASTGGTGVTGKISHVAVNAGSTYALTFSSYDGSSLSEAMRIDSSGNVGIGTTSPSSFTGLAANNLVVGSGSGNEGMTIYSGNAANNYGAIAFADGISGSEQYRGYILYQHDIDSLRFASSATERMRIDSSGRVGIGTTSPAAKLDTAYTDSSTYSSTSPSADLILSRKNTDNTNNETVGIRFDVTGWSGSTTGGAAIEAIQPSNASTADLAFLTRDAGTWGERMRIDSSGNLLVGTTSSAHARANIRVADGIQVGGMVTLRQSDIYNSGNGRTFTITGGSNGAQSFLEFTAYNRYGYVRKNYFCYNASGSWTIVENESATNGTPPTVTVTNAASTATIVVTGAGTSPSTFGGGLVTTNFDSSYVSLA